MIVSLSLALLSAGAPSGPVQPGFPQPQRRGRADRMDLVHASNGFSLLLPHQIFELDPSGNPTQNLVQIRREQDLIDNVSAENPVLPQGGWAPSTVLPDGSPGNHFVYMQFSQPLEIDSVLSSSPAGQASSGLLGSIVVLAVDPVNGQAVPVQGRAFIGGKTYAGTDPNNVPQLELQTWVSARDDGTLVALDVEGETPGLGFPFTEPGSTSTAPLLVSSSVFLFVPDADGDLSTHETFPVGRQIQVRAATSVQSTSGLGLARTALAGAVVGPDALAPEVIVFATVPSLGSVGVDPLTTIRIKTTEPVQPLSIGTALVEPAGPGLAAQIEYGPPQQATPMPFTLLPISIYDFTAWELTPAYPFPGQGQGTCGSQGEVRVNFPAGLLLDLYANASTQSGSTFFEVGAGPGLVNAPIAPDAIYVARTGALPGLSVIDLNGFGQSTGDPRYDPTYTSFPEGWSKYALNPNLILYGPVLFPPLLPPTCATDGGSAGVFTLTLDSGLDDHLLRPPLVTTVGDMALGSSLDLLYNNGKDAGGCLAGGGNLCAITGKKVVEVTLQPSGALGPVQPGQTALNQVPGGGNPISFAPHPNPPPLIFPPLCQQPFIGGQEPTSAFAGEPVASGGLGLANLLVPGDPFGDPGAGLPPSGLLSQVQNAWFEGPDRASLPNASACLEHQFRQQIGHLLYVIDRARREVLVLNSNRMQVLERIALPDPTELAMSPNLDLLAVTNQSTDEVHFIDADPTSPSFHQVVQVTPVGRGPRGIAWDPGNEDVLVCNEQGGDVSVLSTLTLAERKRVGGGSMSQPFDVVIGQRQSSFGTLRNVYFAWILDRTGELWLFESGPAGVNGWGYDDVIGKAGFTLERPKRLALDVEDLSGAVWLLHEEPLDPAGVPTGELGGAVTRVRIESPVTGMIPLVPGSSPQFRGMSLEVDVSLGESLLTGIPVDLAFDDQHNFGALPNLTSPFAAGVALALNGKSQVKDAGPNGPVAAKRASFLFLAVPSSSEGPGVVDVIELGTLQRVDTNPYLAGVQSIPAPGAIGLMDYWRQ